tara:strand:+ start:633 stop:1358 length:726 start_codon:yes stop_codon:yes gene_type:complete
MSIINQIILLQDVDNKLFEIEKLLGDLPSKVKDLSSEEESVKSSLKDKEEDLKNTTVLISTNETLVQTTSQKVSAFKDKLVDGSISTNKEYDAMMETIDFEKNVLNDKENELIDLMSKKEVLSKEIEEDKSALDGIINELKSKKEDLNLKMEEVSEEQNALKSERSNIVKDITDDTLEKYSQIYEARKGVACSEILDNNCEGCGAYIPPQIVNEALAKEIVNCGTCSRFLFKYSSDEEGNT